MATLNNVLKVIEQHLEFPRSRSTGIARRLQEAGLLPSGAPGVPPILDEDGVLDLVVALASDTELHTAVSAVRAYHAMTPGGADLSGAPDTIPNAPIAIARAGPGCLDSAPLDLSGFLPGYAERGALRFCRCVGRA